MRNCRRLYLENGINDGARMAFEKMCTNNKLFTRRPIYIGYTITAAPTSVHLK